MVAQVTNRRARRLLSLSAVLILAVTLFSGRIVPIYDGIGFPDEPYRYVEPLSDAQKTSSPPSVGEDVASMTSGANADYISIASFEQGPQVVLYFAPKSVTVAPSVTSLDVQAQPKAPTASDQPAYGVIAGNIYAIITDHPASFQDKTHDSIISLRVPTGNQSSKDRQVIEFRATGKTAWRQLDTAQVGSDIFQTVIVGFGDYAMANIKPAAPTPSAKTTNTNTSVKQPALHHTLPAPIIALAVLLLLIVLAIISIRLNNGQRKRRTYKNGSKRR